MKKIKITHNIQLRGLNKEMFEKLKSTKVLTAGSGKIASKAMVNLSNAGIGTIGMIENDKAELVFPQVQKYNYNAAINIHNELLESQEAEKIIQEYDIIVDCLHNYDLKYRLNELAVKYNKPMIFSNVTQKYAQIAIILPHKTACLNCIYAQKDLSNYVYASETSVMSESIAAVQTDIVVDFVLGLKRYPADKMISYYHLDQRFNSITLTKNDECSICSKAEIPV